MQRASRETILAAAASEFAEMGFDGARIDRMARRAGINKAMLYYHVGDKKALYDAVFESVQTQAKVSLERILEEGGDSREMFRKAIESVVALAFNHPVYPSMILREVAGGGANVGEEAVRRLEGVFSLVRRILEMGAEQGVMRRTDPALAQFLVAGSVMFLAAGIPFRRRLALSGSPSGPLEPSDMAEKLSDLLINGLSSGGV